MHHLDPVRIAAFDHESPTTEELAHLAACAVCRDERDAFSTLRRVAVTDDSAMGDAMSPRLTNWETLSITLRREGLLTSASDHRVPEAPLVVRALDGSGERIARDSVLATPRAAVSRARAFPSWMRSAAAVALVAGGAALGRVSAGASALPLGFAAAGANVSVPVGDASFASVAQATAVLGTAQREYERASLWLAANDSSVRDSDVYRARLAALDQMMAASRAALRDAPQDPVLNHYFLAASTAREATLQQLGGTLPVDKTLEGY